MYLQQIQNQIEQILNKKHNINAFLQSNYKSDKFDFFLPLFPYVKDIKKNLLDIFEIFKQDLSLEVVDNIFFENGFLNIKLNRKIISKNILTNIDKSIFDYEKKADNVSKVVIFDYSSPNIAKNFSIGHLRSTVIGNALKNVYKKLGFRTVGINHLGDWGTQFGKMIFAYKKWAQKENILKDPINELQRVYILFHEETQKDKSLEDEAREIFRLLENKDPEITDLWNWFKKISLEEFKKIYDLLDIHFDHYIGESFFHDKAIELLDELRQKNLVLFDDQAYIMPLDDGMPPALMQKKNKSTLYLTRDVACVIYRYKRFNFYKVLYVVGNEQKLHYKQLKAVLNKIGYDNLNLEHVNFGLVHFQNMKISTRKSIDFKLINIIESAKKEAQNIIQKRFSDTKKIEQIAQKVSIGAIVFNDLKNDRHLDIEFDLKKMLQFEGNNGPYLQYTMVRLYSILKKSQVNENLHWEEIINYYSQFHYYNLIKLIDSFYEILEKVQQKNMPSILARYLLQLAKNINQFYEKEKILNTDNLVLQDANILLIKNCLNLLEEGLKILGIPILKEM
ncbi:arginine--tRNA ligase ['Camptotheca acuminata' phytoplasma]|uniref:arginine--tRNA ligase n=1 Tax='Camptotheca acuminata' phytoplasma TaxID=3239192 RepID=UPI00351A6ADE